MVAAAMPLTGGLPLLALRGGSSVVQAGVVSSAASLTKNIMGIGVLTVAAGMAAGTGVAPATIAMAVFHMTAAYTFALFGELCASTGLGSSCTFQGIWIKTLGGSSAWLVSASIGALTFSICAVYLICLGELLPPLLAQIRAPDWLRSRRAAILIAAAFVIPSCFAHSLAGLWAVSLLGVGALAYTALFSLLRCSDGSYKPCGRFFDSMPAELRASFGRDTHPWRMSRNTAVLIANLGVALCVHFNAPGFYRSLAKATPARFAAVTYMSFGCVFVLTLLIALPGYLTFGGACQPLVLSNYHPTSDGAATAARCATAASLCCSFPLVFAALRETALSLAVSAIGDAASVAGSRSWWIATLLLPAAAVSLALAVSDLGLVVGLLGSLLGGGIMYAAPAAMHAAAVLATPAGSPVARSLTLLVDALLVIYGVVGQMLVGTIITWQHSRNGPSQP